MECLPDLDASSSTALLTGSDISPSSERFFAGPQQVDLSPGLCFEIFDKQTGDISCVVETA